MRSQAWRRILAALVLACAAPVAFAQARPAAAERPAAPSLPANASEQFAPMRDGVRLAANVFLPAGRGPFPVIVTRTPYIKDNERYLSRESWGRYVDAGFAFVVQDTRGRGRSEGHYEAFVDDMEDGYDTIEWIAAQPWSNGRVGITGGSAMGITGNLAAIANPPHLTAAYVIVAPAARRRASVINGVLKEEDTVGWLRGQDVSEADIAALRRRVYDNQLDERGEIIPGRRFIDIPMYNVGGWYDIFSEGALSNFAYLQNHGLRGARGNQKLFMGPFGHGPLSGDLTYPGFDRLTLQSQEELRWFDYWLNGNDNGIMDEPPVSYFMMAGARNGAYSVQNRMVRAANWPPASRETRFYLGANRALTREAPSAANASVTYRFDPARPVATVGGANLTFDRGPMDQRAIPARQDYLRFATPALTEDVVVAGNVRVELFASTDGPDTDFIVKLVDVYPDGYEAIVLDAPIRARFRNGFGQDDETPMIPGAPVELDIDLWSTAITFEAGHRIALHVTSSSAPRFELNPNTGRVWGDGRPRVARNTVYFDASRPSALVLPVIEAPAPAAN